MLLENESTHYRTGEDVSLVSRARLLQMASGVIVQQALYAAAKLGVADLLNGGARRVSEIAAELNVNEAALLRIMRLLASQGVFRESAPGTFANNELSDLLRSGIQGSFRSLVMLRGSQSFFAPFGEILYSIQTGLPAKEKLYGKDLFEKLKDDPEIARIFDDAMTDMSEWMGTAIATSYDFGRWGRLMDVGGGNGMLLAQILRVHPRLRGVLADLPHVLERAQERGFFAGDLGNRTQLQPCDFFQEVPTGCRAYLMKNVIHDWDDERAHKILCNCRRAVPDDGVLLLAQWAVPDENMPSPGRIMDIAMMILTGGKERSVEEHRALLAAAGFHLKQVFPVPGEFSIIEAVPV
jgi:SAM-dependent methyltransferase